MKITTENCNFYYYKKLIYYPTFRPLSSSRYFTLRCTRELLPLFTETVIKKWCIILIEIKIYNYFTKSESNKYKKR